MSFFTFILYLFCTFIRPQDWVPGFYGMRLINGLAIATIMFLTFEKLLGRDVGLVKVSQNGLMVGLFGCVLMSQIVHTYFAGLISSFSRFSINFILFFLLLNTINSTRKFKITIWFIFLLIVSLVFQGIYQKQFGYGWAGQGMTIGSKGGDDWRINWIGIFNDPNDLALTFVMGIGIIITFLFGKSSFMQKIVGFPAVGLLIYGIYLTNSRGGMLALMTAVFFYFIRRSRRFVLGAIVGSIFVFGLFTFGPSRMTMLSSSEDSAYGRIELWYEGIMMMKSNPFFGIGYNMFTDSLPQTAHNSFVLAGAELGFIGLFFFVGLIYVSFRQLSIIQQFDEEWKNYACSLQSALVGFCAAAYFLSRTYIILPYLLFALSGALFFIASQKNEKIKYKFTGKEMRRTALISFGIILITYGIVRIGI